MAADGKSRQGLNYHIGKSQQDLFRRPDKGFNRLDGCSRT